jgi:hypothetical protein
MDLAIFRSLQYNKSNHKCTISKINKPLSYTRSKELPLEAQVPIDNSLILLKAVLPQIVKNNHILK